MINDEIINDYAAHPDDYPSDYNPDNLADMFRLLRKINDLEYTVDLQFIYFLGDYTTPVQVIIYRLGSDYVSKIKVKDNDPDIAVKKAWLMLMKELRGR